MLPCMGSHQALSKAPPTQPLAPRASSPPPSPPNSRRDTSSHHALLEDRGSGFQCQYCHRPLHKPTWRQEAQPGLPQVLLIKLLMHAKLLLSCLTLCNPIDHASPGSFVRGIFQARILEWGAIDLNLCRVGTGESGLVLSE